MTTEPEPSEPALVPPARWGLGDAALTLLLTLVVGSGAYALIHSLTRRVWSTPQDKAWATILLVILPWLALAGWPLLTSMRRGNGPRQDFGLRLDWPSALTGILGGIATYVVAGIVAAIQVSVTGESLSSAVGTVAQSTVSASKGALAVLALCTLFGAPIAEEVAFRGLLFGALRKRGAPTLASVLVTALVFAAFHFELRRIVVLLVLGLGITLVRARTGSTAASMLAHMTINFPGALLFLLMSTGQVAN